jgi:hypothetical protein
MSRIHKLAPMVPALLVSLFLAGCAGTSGSSAGAQGTAAPTAGTPSAGTGGTNLDIQVTQLSVASNFEIRGQITATNNGTANVQELAFMRIRLTLPGSEPAFEAVAPSIQGGVMDTRPMAGLPPGMTRPYGFSAAPGTILKKVARGDEVTGVLTLSADGRTMEVSLPVTTVTPQRIP